MDWFDEPEFRKDDQALLEYQKDRYENKIFDNCNIDGNYIKFFLKNFFYGNNYWKQIIKINDSVKNEYTKLKKLRDNIDNSLLANLINIPLFFTDNYNNRFRYYPDKGCDFMVFPKDAMSLYIAPRVTDDTRHISKNCFSECKFKYTRNNAAHDCGPFGVGTQNRMLICAASISDEACKLNQCLILSLYEIDQENDSPAFYMFYYSEDDNNVYKDHYLLDTNTILTTSLIDGNSKLSDMWCMNNFQIYKCSKPFISDSDIQLLRSLDWILKRSKIESNLGPTYTRNYKFESYSDNYEGENIEDEFEESFPIFNTNFMYRLTKNPDSWWTQLYFKCINNCLLNIIKDAQENKYNNTFLKNGWISSKHALYPVCMKNSSDNIFNTNFDFEIGDYFSRHFNSY